MSTTDHRAHHPAQRPEIVCLCGSVRFPDHFARLTRQLTLSGAVVLSPGLFPTQGDTLTAEEIVRLGELHLRKIDLADRVIVLAPGGHIGEATSREITYANAQGTPVEIIDPHAESPGPPAGE